jgi:hypothetical protein
VTILFATSIFDDIKKSQTLSEAEADLAHTPARTRKKPNPLALGYLFQRLEECGIRNRG